MSPRAGARRLARAGAGRLAGLVPPAARAAVFRRLGPRLGVAGAERGLVTVVVPVADVDLPRLPDTLASLREQPHGYREVLLAPVGPEAAAGARRTARERDPRELVLPAAGTWQEAANRAAGRARGRWLLFHRGCDPLPLHALTGLSGALAATGSAAAVGRVEQRGPAEEWVRRAQRTVHARPGRAVAPADRPELAGDLVVGGKLVRTDLWRATGAAFGPDDDWLLAPTLLRLLLAADRVDLVDVAGAEYLPDHGRRPFGAMPSPLPGLPAWQRAAAIVEETLAGSPLADGWRDHAADVAVPRFLKDAERADDGQWAALRALAAAYAGHADARPDRVRAESRALLWLAARDRRRDVEALAAEAHDLGEEVPTAVDGPDLLARWRSAPDDLPAHTRVVSPGESPLVAEVVRLRPAGDAGVDVDLAVRVDHLDLAAVDATLHAEPPGGPAAPVPARVDAAATRWSRSRFHAALAATVRVPAAEGTLRLRLVAGALERAGEVPLADPVARDPGADRRVVVRGLALRGEDLAVELDGDPGLLRLVDDHGTVHARAVPGPGGAALPLRHESFGRTAPLPTGWYRLVTPAGNPVLGDQAAALLPVDQVGDRHRLRAHVGPRGGLVVWLAAPLADDEQGARAQERLVAAYRTEDRPVDPGIAYFESYAGRSATDSPLAVHAELRARRPGLRTYWGIADHAQSVPEGAVPVLLRSREWYGLLARAGCLVLNTDVEEWFRRRPGQVLLQCFHGYPSKGMGLGQWRAMDLPPSRIAALRARTVDAWSVILTPTPEMTGHYREQYGYDGPALERGYPRDDDLTAPGAAARRAATRRLLGVRDGQAAVLYAPTWREHLATRPRGAAMADLLDVDAATDALGDGHVLLLRGHRFHEPRPRGPRVVDVTAYPEVNDLILAADVAVLDYSSLRFDFALTGKPMVFLVPDLAEYGSGTRSFLFPFAESAPGPFVDDTAGVVAEVRDPAALRERWAGPIAAFNARFHPWQDGRATARVVDGLLALLDAAPA